MAEEFKYSCNTASETLEWIHAIINFIAPYRYFLDAHVVNFFKDRLWEAVDKEWMDCLQKESVENLLRIPSGVVQDHWPGSLKDFILTLRSLCLSREQADFQEFSGMHIASLSSVLAQGMNHKKKHEVEVLSALVSLVAKQVGARTIVDVGAGQGYLAQVLAFDYQLSVIAIDACSHHGKITDARAERIRKHYAAKMRKNWTFLECDKAKAVISVGCCYNLLSEEAICVADSCCGFPVSQGVKSAGVILEKSARDLACQSADRWRGLGENAGLHNFELHAFRAAFQIVLCRHYPSILLESPTIGRQGKALRRQQNQRILESNLHHGGSSESGEPRESVAFLHEYSSIQSSNSGESNAVDRCSLFAKFCESGLGRLHLPHLADTAYSAVWRESESYAELIGPYWSLRAALGPVLETLILLDRLLLLQEYGSDLEVYLQERMTCKIILLISGSGMKCTDLQM
ncbi:protein RRNAD1 isoform X4 [Solanum pennellii]|uniref:Protein RRNAD1 isoform X4 n=1 Tax=Solanum pennellii TaxID=28526 RepID=A0ABM1VFD6_SOLPN|nr:protein RRNAD1 isoform X4 [Solanum pennellii]